MEKPEIGVGGGSDGSPTGEQAGATVRRILVPIVYEEDEEVFEFCIDQLLNGNYEQSRTALKCLVQKKCDKLNLQGFTAMVEKKKAQLELNNQIQQQPSTSKAKPPQTQAKCTQEQLGYLRKCRERLKKKSPTKYEKTLNKARDFYNQRWAQMSDEEKSDFNKRILDAALEQYRNVTAEKRREKNRMSYQRVKNDEVQMEKIRATKREYYAQQKANESNQHQCKFVGCDKSFVKKCNLVQHECSHLSIKPFSCTWANCQFSAKQRGDVIKHVRMQHFKLPRTKQQQQDLNIVDNRDPNDYVRENQELTKRRLE